MLLRVAKCKRLQLNLQTSLIFLSSTYLKPDKRNILQYFPTIPSIAEFFSGFTQETSVDNCFQFIKSTRVLCNFKYKMKYLLYKYMVVFRHTLISISILVNFFRRNLPSNINAINFFQQSLEIALLECFEIIQQDSNWICVFL